MSDDRPTYDLARVQALVRDGAWRVTVTAMNGAGELGFDSTDISGCLLALTTQDFHKTMPAERMPGLFQDVYKPTYRGQALYVKVQLVESRAGQATLVISFKRK